MQNTNNKFTLDRGKLHKLLFCLIIAFGATLRFYRLDSESYWFDEIFTAYLVRDSAQNVLVQILTYGFLARDATYFFLANFWVQIFGTTETATRSLSVIFGIASIGLMYVLGRELFGTRIGLASALLMATSEFQIRYS